MHLPPSASAPSPSCSSPPAPPPLPEPRYRLPSLSSQVQAFDVRRNEPITSARLAWQGPWWFSTSCYVNPTATGCCGACI